MFTFPGLDSGCRRAAAARRAFANVHLAAPEAPAALRRPGALRAHGLPVSAPRLAPPVLLGGGCRERCAALRCAAVAAAGRRAARSAGRGGARATPGGRGSPGVLLPTEGRLSAVPGGVQSEGE